MWTIIKYLFLTGVAVFGIYTCSQRVRKEYTVRIIYCDSRPSVTIKVREMFHCGLGGYDLKKFRRWGIDEYDIEVFKKYRKEIE